MTSIDGGTMTGSRSDAGPADRDHIWLTTVGIDIGTSTSHLSVSRIHLQRLGDSLSSRFVTVERRVVHESPIVLTPYLPDNLIDADALADLVAESYANAGITAEDVDTGAVILTGEAVKRRNARAINERLAAVAGSFVSTTAGPRLEALIAAHGSGSVARSRAQPAALVLNVDIGGGTTKFAIVRDGRVEATAAISVGGRLVAIDRSNGGRIDRLEPTGAWFAERAGIDVALGRPLDDAGRERIGAAMAAVLERVLMGEGDDPALAPLWVTPPLRLEEDPERLVFSGGVAQYVLRREPGDFGDLGPALGEAIRAWLARRRWQDRLEAPAETIRATVIGASQYTVQVSGNTVEISDPNLLPLRNLRVVSPALTFPLEPPDPVAVFGAIRDHLRHHELDDPDEAFALAFRWRGIPFHASLRAVAEGAAMALEAAGDWHRPLVLLFDGDVGRSVGRLVRTELDWPGPVLSLDGVAVDDFDFVDIGARIEPAGTYPVVVKSLVYPAPDEPPGPPRDVDR